MKKTLAALVTLASLSCGSPALAQDMQLTEGEAAAVTRFAMPRAFQSVQQKCRTALSRSAYMYARGDSLLGRLQDASAGSWDAAHGAIVRMAASENPQMQGILSRMPREALQPFVDEMIAGMLVSRLQTENCAQIDRVLSLLDPLPPQNLADLIALVVVEAQKSKKGKS